MEDQMMVIHGDLNASKIEVHGDCGARIGGFEKSVIIHLNQNDDSLQLNGDIRKAGYMDPEYIKTGKLKIESDVFSFGVVMFETLCGMPISEVKDNGEGTIYLARRWLDDGTIKKKLATSIKEENCRNNLFLKKGPNEDSLDTFINITRKCLAESQNQRPEIKVIIKELHKALSFHENHKDPLRMSFNDIKLATHDFDRTNCIGVGGFGRVYKGKLAEGINSTIVVKKLDKSQGQGEKQYYNELQILNEFKHENIIGLIGYSNETHEKLIVYEHASKGSLDKHLNNATLTWRNRLKICIDVVTGLNFLHEGIQAQGGQAVVIHRDIKTANILLFDDWKAKVADFGLSLRSTMNEETNYDIDHPCGTMDYVDPMYLKSGILTVKSDVYSLGVALLEVLSGKETYTLPKDERQSLLIFIKHKFESEKQNEVVAKAISEEIVPRSLTTFINIVYRCLNADREMRPTTRIVLSELKKALKFQDDGTYQDDEKDKEAHKIPLRNF
ncbi:PTI1-like tyrosine-protein kinase 2 isoform X2 [Rutidosis leptorrhynchoides]